MWMPGQSNVHFCFNLSNSASHSIQPSCSDNGIEATTKPTVALLLCDEKKTKKHVASFANPHTLVLSFRPIALLRPCTLFVGTRREFNGHISSRLFARFILQKIHVENTTGLTQTTMLLLKFVPSLFPSLAPSLQTHNTHRQSEVGPKIFHSSSQLVHLQQIKPLSHQHIPPHTTSS